MSAGLIGQFTLLLSSRVSQKIIGFTSLAIFSRLLSLEEISLMAIFALVADFIAVVFNFGLQPYILRQVPRYSDDEKGARNSLIKTIILINVFCCLFGVIVVYCVNSFFNLIDFDLLSPQLERVFFFGVYCQSLAVFMIQQMVALKMYKMIARQGIVAALIILLLVLAIAPKFGVIGLVYALAVSATYLLISSVYSVFKTADLLDGVGYSNSVSIVAEAMPYYFEGIMVYLRRQGDQLIAVTIIGAEGLGIYFIAKKYAELLQMFVTTLDQIVTPRLAELYERSQIEFKRFMFDVAGWCVWSTVLLFFLAMSAIPIYVYLVGQQGVVDLELIITLLLFKAAFEMIRGVAIGRAVFVATRSIYRLYLTLFEAVILLPLLYVGAKYYGLVGLAIAPVGASVLTVLVGLFFIYKQADFLLLKAKWIKAVLAGAVMVLCLWGINESVLTNPDWLLLKPLVALCMAVVTYLVFNGLVASKEQLKFARMYLRR